MGQRWLVWGPAPGSAPLQCGGPIPGRRGGAENAGKGEIGEAFFGGVMGVSGCPAPFLKETVA